MEHTCLLCANLPLLEIVKFTKWRNTLKRASHCVDSSRDKKRKRLKKTETWIIIALKNPCSTELRFITNVTDEVKSSSVVEKDELRNQEDMGYMNVW